MMARRKQDEPRSFLAPVTAQERDDMRDLFRSISKLDEKLAVRAVLDAAAHFVLIMRYDGRGDPIQALDKLERTLRRLR